MLVGATDASMELNALAHDVAALDALRRPAPMAAFVLFLLLAGCRLSEGLNLRWSDVSLDASVLPWGNVQ